MKGRKPVPSALKLLRNNPGKRRIPANEPHPEALDVDVPAELADDPVACDEWIRSIGPAIRIGLVAAPDRALSIMHCVLWSQWRSELAEANTGPHVIAAGVHKYPRANPARTMANKTLHLLTQVDEKLGFSPTSRGRVQAQRPAPTLAAHALDKRRRRFFALSRG